MAVVHRISEQEYKELVFNDPDISWELWDGVPREKSGMSICTTALPHIWALC